jgi:hypothetical protein
MLIQIFEVLYGVDYNSSYNVVWHYAKIWCWEYRMVIAQAYVPLSFLPSKVY